jgi:hypothetical protein
MSEGVFAASGSPNPGNPGNQETGQNCNSIYMNGVYGSKNGDSINVGYKNGYGCDGCPAASNGRCTVKEISWSGDFSPWWEKNGKKGDELGY